MKMCDDHNEMVAKLATVIERVEGIKSIVERLEARQIKLHAQLTKYGGMGAAAVVIIGVLLKVLGLDIDLSGVSE